MIQRDYKETNYITSLRAIAIILVFFIHSGGGGLREFGKIGNFIIDIGKYGVQIFFVISGFTIFSQLFSEKYSIKDFLVIRFLRISIPYYPIIFILLLYNALGGAQFNGWANKFNEGSISLSNFIAHLVYISPYSLKWQNTIIGVEWTLGIEMFFYFFFAVMVKFKILKNEAKSYILFGGVFYLLYFIFPLVERFFHIDPLSFHWMPFRYGYIFFIGGLSYYLKNKIKRCNDEIYKFISDIVVLAIILSFTLIAINSKINNTIDMELWFVVSTFSLITFFNNKCKLSFTLNNKILVFLGSISYSFYLIHYIVILTLKKSSIIFIDFIFAFSISLIVSFLWYVVFEKKIYMKIKGIIKKNLSSNIKCNDESLP